MVENSTSPRSLCSYVRELLSRTDCEARCSREEKMKYRKKVRCSVNVTVTPSKGTLSGVRC